MGWLSEDYEHEGWTACEMPDGRLTIGVSQGGPDGGVAIGRTDAGELEFVDGRTAVGWRARCDCREDLMSGGTGWVGPLWRRVTDPDRADAAARLVYDPKPDVYGDPPEWVEELIHADWKAHAQPSAEGENVTDAVKHGEVPQPVASAGAEDHRTAVIDALGIVADLIRAGLPLGISWETYPFLDGRVDITGHVLTGTTPDADEVRDTVRTYAEYLGVEATERVGERQDSIHARAVVHGFRVDVWGVTAIYTDVA